MYHLIIEATRKPQRPPTRETERQHFERLAREARTSQRRRRRLSRRRRPAA